jgi:hypothetical protein
VSKLLDSLIFICKQTSACDKLLRFQDKSRGQSITAFRDFFLEDHKDYSMVQFFNITNYDKNARINALEYFVHEKMLIFSNETTSKFLSDGKSCSYSYYLSISWCFERIFDNSFCLKIKVKIDILRAHKFSWDSLKMIACDILMIGILFYFEWVHRESKVIEIKF